MSSVYEVELMECKHLTKSALIAEHWSEFSRTACRAVFDGSCISSIFALYAEQAQMFPMFSKQ